MVSWPSLGLKSTKKKKGKQLGKQTLCVSPQCRTPERWRRPVRLFQNGERKQDQGFKDAALQDWVLKAFCPRCFSLKVTFDTIHLYLSLSPWGLYFYICNLCPGVAVTVIYQDIRPCLSFFAIACFSSITSLKCSI